MLAWMVMAAALATLPVENAARLRADINRDGVVDGADQGLLLGAWGCSTTMKDIETNPCAADLNRDGVVDGADSGLLIGAWGPIRAPEGLVEDAVHGAPVSVPAGASARWSDRGPAWRDIVVIEWTSDAGDAQIVYASVR